MNHNRARTVSYSALLYLEEFSSLQSLNHVRLFAPPRTAARQASLSITNFQSLLKFMAITSVMQSNHLILCRPLHLPPSVFPSIRLFSKVSSSHQAAKVLEFQLQNQSFQWISRTDFLKIDWLNLLATQGTFKSLLQHPSSQASILQPSSSFIVQLSHPYMTTEKTITLSRQTFVGKVMALFFNMLSRFVLAFLPRIKGLSQSSTKLN